MRLFYLDEVGNPSLSKKSLSRDPIFVMCFLVIEDSQWFIAHQLMTDLKARYFPGWDWRQVEVKSRFLRMASANPGDRRLPVPWRALTPAKLGTLEDDLCGVMEAVDGKISLVAIDKPRLVARYRTPIHPYALAYALLKQRAAVLLGSLGAGQLGMMVADRYVEIERNLEGLESAQRMLERGHRWRASMERVIEAPFFVDSRSNQIVQLADFCAYDFYAAVRAHPVPCAPFWRHRDRLLLVPGAFLVTSYRVFPDDLTLNKP